MSDEIRELENQALTAGLAKELLDDPQAGAMSELAVVAGALGVEVPASAEGLNQGIETLRGMLNDLRKARSATGGLVKLESEKARFDQLVSDGPYPSWASGHGGTNRADSSVPCSAGKFLHK